MKTITQRILEYLQNDPLVHRDDLAKTFGISTSQMYSYLKILNESGKIFKYHFITGKGRPEVFWSIRDDLEDDQTRLVKPDD